MKILVIVLFIKLQFVDIKTGETLSGVRIETANGTLYTDMDGYVTVESDKVIKSSYISYKDTVFTPGKSAKIGLHQK